MEKKEEILINEPEMVSEKPSKVKFILAILASTLILATVTTLLIGHLKFDWFKSNEYNINAKINRQIYQANYFSEKKTLTTKISFSNAPSVNKMYDLDSDFVVFLTEKNANINNAILVLLSSKMTSEEGQSDLAHLNLFDKEELKKIELNPDGAKYPLGKFKFTDEGKILEIKLPNNMDEYNAQTIIELIEKVIPKLSRNKQEDISNGLEIKTNTVKNKKIIVQNESPKEYQEFKGSKFSRIVKTEIENEQITNIESKSNIYLESKPEEEEITFGPKDFKFDLNSEIVSTNVKYEQKEDIELIQKISEKFNFIDYQDLLKKIKEKNAEKNKNIEERINPEEKPKSLRQLGFPISGNKEFKLASFNLLGQTITIKYIVSVSSSKAENKIEISSNLGSFSFGNKGCSGAMGDSYKYYQHIFTFVFPNFPAVSVGCYAQGSLSWEIGFQSGSGKSTKLYAKLSGTLGLGAEIKAGWDSIASLSAFAEGTVADASGQVTISNGSVAKGSGFKLKMGKLVAGIRGCLFSKKIDMVKHTIFDGWQII